MDDQNKNGSKINRLASICLVVGSIGYFFFPLNIILDFIAIHPLAPLWLVLLISFVGALFLLIGAYLLPKRWTFPVLIIAILTFLVIWFFDLLYGEFIFGDDWNTETIVWLVILSAPTAIVGLAIAARKAMSDFNRFLIGLLGFVFGVIIIISSKGSTS